MRVAIGDFKQDTNSPLEYKKSYNRWSQRIEGLEFKSPAQNLEELGRVYFYLL